MNNIPNETKRISLKFANAMFTIIVIFFLILAIYSIYKIYNPAQSVSRLFYIISLMSCSSLGFLFFLGLNNLKDKIKIFLSLFFFITGCLLYGFETYLEFFQEEKSKRKIFAKKIGVPFDNRDSMEVLEDLRNNGFNAYPNVGPTFHKSNNGDIFNFGGISNSTTIFNNKAGYYPVIETDEYGFNNPKGLYVKGKVDILLTGDDFAAGKSVRSDESISAVLRQMNFNAISIGRAGNGPLIELAALKEYGEHLKPKIVLWFYYVNDLNELSKEIESPFLRKYLEEDGFSQNLFSKQVEVDEVLKNYVSSQWGKILSEKEKERKRLRRINTLKLTEIRKKINLKPAPISTPSPIFKDILQEAKKIVNNWNGKLYIVYLPALKRYSTGSEHPNRNFVLNTISELDIQIIDIHSEVFKNHPNPLSLFPFKLPYRYNAEGYKLVGEAIGERLEKDKYFPIE